jgi:hypothetical protein
VTRKGEDVTARVIEAATQTVRPPGPMSHVPAFKHELTELSAERPIAVRDALALANDRYPGWRVSDRIALAEQAVWELLHEGGLRLVRPAGEDRYEATTREEWGPLLLAWATWCDPHPQAYLAAARPD